MAVRIRQSPVTNAEGTFGVHPDIVLGDLMIIADMDGSFGADPDPGDAAFELVQFSPATPADTSTAAGRVQEQLERLVDRPTNLDIYGVGFDFIYGDGATIETSPGLTLGTGTIFYDTSNVDGDGRWIIGTNGDEECTPTVGILHHEMGHALLAQADPLHPEADAVVQENDLRTRLGLVPRDTGDLRSGSGCPDSGCCIVASVATGSGYSAEVHALRRVRDRVLRSTRLGSRLFEALYDEYYRFSTRVCRIMVVDPAAKSNVETWLVLPLVRALEIALDHTRHPDDPRRLGRMLLDDAAEGRFLAPDDPEGGWDRACLFLACAAGGELPQPEALDEGTAAICRLLADELPRCPHVLWAIVEPLAIYAAARAAAEGIDGGDELRAERAGRALGAALDEWIARVPLEGWRGLPPAEVAREFDEISATIFTNRAARAGLIDRIGTDPALAPALGVAATAAGSEAR